MDANQFHKLLVEANVLPSVLTEHFDVSLGTAERWISGTAAPAAELRPVIIATMEHSYQ